jgi:hypothetical protein
MGNKSIAAMADDILKGALTDSSKNPFDAKGNKHAHPAVPSDSKLLEITDDLRESFIGNVLGKPAKPQSAPTPNPRIDEKKKETKGIFISESDLGVLRRAKEIISRLEEATTTGNIGTAQAPTMKKKDKKLKARQGIKAAKNFLDYIAKN